MSFIDFMCSLYGYETRIEMVLVIIFWTIGAFMAEMMIYSLIEAMVQKIKKPKNITEEPIEDESFFIEGLENLEDYDIFTPIN